MRSDFSSHTIRGCRSSTVLLYLVQTAEDGKKVTRNLVGKILGKIKIFVQDFVPIRAVLMGTKSCTKILNFSTRFSCENLAVEDFVTLLMGKKSC